jgi:predicted transcriptional regulator
MDTETKLTKSTNGKRFTNARRLVIIAKLIECLGENYYSTNELAKITGLTRATVDTYRPLADDVISKQVLNRNNIRNLQVKRTYRLIEMLMNDLKTCESIKEKTLIYSQIAKFSQHLALITGLNIETHVNVDYQQLVIVRSNGKKSSIENESGEAIKPIDMITLSTPEAELV